ncbi:hypothetical protein HBJ00_14270 [Aeromonas veronii]|jgi:Ni2+-binding GTPase involved in maturation of urease and hydrogenase|uniref:hypothetical protein n=1 Tax=Aeromonas TaxID=642 RepID=UPI001430CF98|nr:MULTISPECIES: hypothetical protein [Aeromonas]NJI19838.1 hypothetical protein [Aeromonas veronii]WIW80874.1 hypothetical protein 1903_00062 [Aeromonas salmonicida subsp. salmonicida]
MNNTFLSQSAHFVMPDSLFGDPHYNLAVWGTSGAGKTALLQPILQSMREQLEPVNEAELAAVQANCTLTLHINTAHSDASARR